MEPNTRKIYSISACEKHRVASTFLNIYAVYYALPNIIKIANIPHRKYAFTKHYIPCIFFIRMRDWCWKKNWKQNPQRWKQHNKTIQTGKKVYFPSFFPLHLWIMCIFLYCFECIYAAERKTMQFKVKTVNQSALLRCEMMFTFISLYFLPFLTL